jgi:hypothetical protein
VLGIAQLPLSLTRFGPRRSLLSCGANLTTFHTCLDPSEQNKLIAFSWATNKNTLDVLRRHSSAGGNAKPICRRAESLARAPDFRLMVVEPAKSGDTIPGFKDYWSKHIEPIQLLCPFLAPGLPFLLASGS